MASSVNLEHDMRPIQFTKGEAGALLIAAIACQDDPKPPEAEEYLKRAMEKIRQASSS